MGNGESRHRTGELGDTGAVRAPAASTDSGFPAPHPRLFVLVAGEASGDQLGAGLIIALRERFPKARFAGIGGPLMATAGMQLWHQAQALSVMGLVEVLAHLPRLLAIRGDVYRRTRQLRPDAFIGIDAPDFNLGLERRLKRAGIRTVHYVSPSIWAWRERRAAKIGASADRVLCLFPMEPAIYAKHGVDARFVGHPLADAFALEPDQAAARRALNLPDAAPVLALLPGSRLGEIRRLGPDFLAAAQLLVRQIPQLHIVAPMANTACRAAFEQHIADAGLPAATCRLLDGRAHEALIAADAAMLASGTVALEAMLAKKPMVVAYRLAPTTYRLIKWLGLLRTSVYSLPNILAKESLVPELMQDACTPAALAAAVAPWLAARAMPEAMRAAFQRVHLELRRGADRNAAEAVAELIARGPQRFGD